MTHPGPPQQLPPAYQPRGGRTGGALGYNLGARSTALGLGALGAVGLTVAAIWPVHSVDGGQPTCIVRILFNLPCPGCGMTRAWVHAAHGDLAGAFWLNPFGLVLMAMAAFAAVYVGQALIRRRPPEGMLDLIRPQPVLAVFSLWIVWSAYRMWSVAQGQEMWASVLA